MGYQVVGVLRVPGNSAGLGRRHASCLGFQGFGVSGFRVFGFRVSRFRVFGFRVSGFRVLGFRVLGLGSLRFFGVLSLGFRVSGDNGKEHGNYYMSHSLHSLSCPKLGVPFWGSL